MNVHFLSESTQVKNNSQGLFDIFRKYHELAPWGKVDQNLADGKPGKYFVSDYVKDNNGVDCRIFCLSFSKTFKAFVNYISIFLLYDDGGSYRVGGVDFPFGYPVEKDDMRGRRISSKFIRDVVNILSKKNDPYDMHDYLENLHERFYSREWGK